MWVDGCFDKCHRRECGLHVPSIFFSSFFLNVPFPRKIIVLLKTKLHVITAFINCSVLKSVVVEEMENVIEIKLYFVV
jgi:hypothetical protein